MPYECEVRDVAAIRTLATTGTCAHDQIGPTLGRLYGKVQSAMREHGFTMTGPPYSKYTDWRESDCDLEAGCPVEGDGSPTGEVFLTELPACKAVVTLHCGHYSKLPEAHAAVQQWIKENGKEFAGPCWEIYLTDPEKEPDQSKWLTEVYYPVQARWR